MEATIKKYQEQLAHVSVSDLVCDTIVNITFAKRAVRRAVTEAVALEQEKVIKKTLICINKEENLKKCPCTIDCIRKGICCECISFHVENGGIPACIKPKLTLCKCNTKD